MARMWGYKCAFSQDSYLVHGEVSVVEVAAASLEANLRHAVVNQKEIPQLRETKFTIKLLLFTNSPNASNTAS